MGKGRDAKLHGPWMSLAMVVGTMIGSGVYLLPTTLAPHGPNALVAWAVTIGGTMCLAYAFALQAAVNPAGPHSYIKSAFGEQIAFLTSWSYIVSQWTGVAAVSVAVAGALAHVWKPLAAPGLTVPMAIASIAVLLIVNLRGARAAGALQIVATSIKVIPLVVVVGLVASRFASGAPVEALAPTPLTIAGVGAASALMLFSLTGFEGAAMTSTKTRDPERTVPFATMFGTGITGLAYIAAVTAVMLLLPFATAAKSSSPFADAIMPVWGPGASAVVALITAISAFGTLNALLLITAEITVAVARNGDLPKVLTRTDASDTATAALIAAAAIAALMVFASSSRGFVQLYVFITLVSTVSVLVLYLVGAAAALRHRMGTRARLLVFVGIIYAIWTFVGSGAEAFVWGMALLAIGWPVRLISRWLNGSSPAAAERSAGPPESSA
jgi:APA family basic amino acid/polyamine antiporter